MRSAYRGRAAAYQKKGDYEKALADHNLVVLYYAIEVEILNGLTAPDRGTVLQEAAEAYRARGACLEALGRLTAAQLDRKRADGLQTSAQKLASKETAPGPIRLINAWTEPVTVTVGGVPYRVDAGAQRDIPVSAEVGSYEVQAGPYRQTWTLHAGKTYMVRAPAP